MSNNIKEIQKISLIFSFSELLFNSLIFIYTIKYFKPEYLFLSLAFQHFVGYWGFMTNLKNLRLKEVSLRKNVHQKWKDLLFLKLKNQYYLSFFIVSWIGILAVFSPPLLALLLLNIIGFVRGHYYSSKQMIDLFFINKEDRFKYLAGIQFITFGVKILMMSVIVGVFQYFSIDFKLLILINSIMMLCLLWSERKIFTYKFRLKLESLGKIYNMKNVMKLPGFNSLNVTYYMIDGISVILKITLFYVFLSQALKSVYAISYVESFVTFISLFLLFFKINKFSVKIVHINYIVFAISILQIILYLMNKNVVFLYLYVLLFSFINPLFVNQRNYFMMKLLNNSTTNDLTHDNLTGYDQEVRFREFIFNMSRICTFIVLFLYQVFTPSMPPENLVMMMTILLLIVIFIEFLFLKKLLKIHKNNL